MSCDETEELLAAFSLSALSEDEAGQVRRHLIGCRRHDQALAEFRTVAEALPLAVEEQEPPAELRARLLAAFDAETATRSGQIAPLRRRTAPVRLRRPALTWLAAAAALFLAVGGLVAWNLTLELGGGGEPRLTATLAGTVGRAEMVYFQNDQAGVLRLDLPALPPGRAYQAWHIGPGGPVSLGLVPNKGAAAFSADLSQSSAVAITDEPAEGSEQPTAAPLLAASLP